VRGQINTGARRIIVAYVPLELVSSWCPNPRECPTKTLQSIGRKTHGGYPDTMHAASCTNTPSTLFIATKSSVRRLSAVLYHSKQRRVWWAGPHLSYRRSTYAFISGRIASLSSGVWLRGADLHRDFRLYASCLSIWSHTRVWFAGSDPFSCPTIRLPCT